MIRSSVPRDGREWVGKDGSCEQKIYLLSGFGSGDWFGDLTRLLSNRYGTCAKIGAIGRVLRRLWEGFMS